MTLKCCRRSPGLIAAVIVVSTNGKGYRETRFLHYEGRNNRKNFFLDWIRFFFSDVTTWSIVMDLKERKRKSFESFSSSLKSIKMENRA